MTASEEKYFVAKDLYLAIKENFKEIEEGTQEDKSDLIDETIEDAETALEVIDDINIKVLKKIHPDNIYILSHNIERFKDQATYVLKTLKKLKSEVSQRHPLPPEMWPEKERKEHQKHINQLRGAAKRSKHWDDKTEEFDILGEGFISLEEYIKIKEQHEL